MGASYFIDGLATVILGAMVVKAGRPNVIGTFIGAVMIAILSNGLTLLTVPYFVGSILKGVLMLIGVAAISLFAAGKRRTPLRLA